VSRRKAVAGKAHEEAGENTKEKRKSKKEGAAVDKVRAGGGVRSEPPQGGE
jgi:hypothetical protein